MNHDVRVGSRYFPAALFPRLPQLGLLGFPDLVLAYRAWLVVALLATMFSFFFFFFLFESVTDDPG